MKEIKDYEITRFEAGQSGEGGEINEGRGRPQCRPCNDSVDDVPSLEHSCCVVVVGGG